MWMPHKTCGHCWLNFKFFLPLTTSQNCCSNILWTQVRGKWPTISMKSENSSLSLAAWITWQMKGSHTQNGRHWQRTAYHSNFIQENLSGNLTQQATNSLTNTSEKATASTFTSLVVHHHCQTLAHPCDSQAADWLHQLLLAVSEETD